MKPSKFAVLLFCLPMAHSHVQQKAEAQNDLKSAGAQTVLSNLQSNTSIFIKIDSTQLELPKASASQLASGNETIDFLQRSIDEFASRVNRKSLYGLIDLPYSFGQPHLRLFVEKSANSNQFFKALSEQLDFSKPFENDGYMMASWGATWVNQIPYAGATFLNSTQVLETPGDLPIPKERWSAALELIKDYPIQVAIVPPDYLWKTYEETMADLPDELGGGPVTTLTKGLKFMAIGIDPKAMTMLASVQSGSPEAAEQFAKMLPTILDKVTLTLPQPYQKTCQTILAEYGPSIQREIEGDRIVYSLSPLDKDEAATKFATIAEQVLTTFLAKEAKPQLRELAVAIHNFESAFGCFPAAKNQRNADGSSSLSWRVHILPFLEGHGELYKQFKLDEPWDSPNNLPLLKKMPDVFQTGSFKLAGKSDPIPEGHTTLLAPVGEGTIVGGKDLMTFGKITDGTSNTIMLVKVKPEHAVPWTAPQDYKFDPAKPATGLDVDAAGNFMSAFADGSVHEIPADLPAKTMLHLFQMNDGQVVDLPR
jgi:hypothetical protein